MDTWRIDIVLPHAKQQLRVDSHHVDSHHVDSHQHRDAAPPASSEHHHPEPAVSLAHAFLRIRVLDIPDDLRYLSSIAIYRVGTSILPNRVASVIGAHLEFSVHPPLPHGLLLNSRDGEISGTPLTPFGPALFTVVAENPMGATATDIAIDIIAAPVKMAYETPDMTCCSGQAIAENRVMLVEHAVSSVEYDALPALPKGIEVRCSAMHCDVMAGTDCAIDAADQVDRVLGSIHGTPLFPSLEVDAFKWVHGSQEIAWVSSLRKVIMMMVVVVMVERGGGNQVLARL
eukprot:2464930-Rhodomonas_salina.5